MTVWQCLLYPICHTFFFFVFFVLYKNVLAFCTMQCVLHHHQNQVLNRGGRWGTTYDFATIFFLPYSFDTVYVIVYSIAFNDLLSKIVGCFLYLRLSPP